jgi:mono/diheme cytochrome c family protein
MISRTASYTPLCAAILLGCGLWLPLAGGEQQPPPDRQALIKRGDYLVNEVARCGDCHTPRNARGRLDRTRHLQGAKMWFRPVARGEEFEDKAPNITLSGKAGKWSEEKMINFLTSGSADPPMPSYHLTRDDARAVAAYLRSLKGRKGTDREGRGEEGERKRGGKKREKERERDDD